MNIKYKNFEIEEDRNWFILSEYWNNKEWKYVQKDQIYPSTLENCILRIAHKLKRDAKATVELWEYLKLAREINDELLTNIKWVTLIK